MASSNGNISRFNGPLCGEFTGHRWIQLTKARDAGLWYFLLICLSNGWANNRDACDLTRHYAHYGGTVMGNQINHRLERCPLIARIFKPLTPINNLPIIHCKLNSVCRWPHTEPALCCTDSSCMHSLQTPGSYGDTCACLTHLLLTHWGRDKMASIFQTTISIAFSWMKMFKFRLRFHWSLFPRVQLTIFQHWFR